jgi:xylulokinase
VTRSGPFLVALDIGTGSVRAHLLDVRGVRVASASRPVRLDLGADGRAEVDLEQIWGHVCAVLPEILANIAPGRLLALGVASALGYVLLDEQGRPLGGSILWMDRRAGVEAVQLASLLNEERLYRITGRNLDPEIFLAKLLWIRRHEPERYARTRCFVGTKDDVIRRLTGAIASDPTHASYSMLYDVVRRAWSDEILSATDVSRSLLPPLRRAAEVAGRVTREAASCTGLPEGLPVVTGASDGTVGCLAAGIATPGTAVNVTGTSDVLMTSTTHPILDPERRTLLNPHPVADGWMVGGIMGTTGGALKWFAETCCRDLPAIDRYRILDAEAANVGVGARGVICLTGLTGERAPLWNPAARGVLFGLDLGHGRAEIVRAILEGVALGVRSVAEVLRESGADIRRIRVVGGGAASALWNQIRADAIGVPVERPSLTEGTATGIAVLAGLGVGVYLDLAEAARTIAPVDAVYVPDPVRHQAYDALATVRQAVYAGACEPFSALNRWRVGTETPPAPGRSGDVDTARGVR